MVTKGIINGVKLDPMDDTMGQYASCEYGKVVHKLISKIREPQHCDHFSDEVYTDI